MRHAAHKFIKLVDKSCVCGAVKIDMKYIDSIDGRTTNESQMLMNGHPLNSRFIDYLLLCTWWITTAQSNSGSTLGRGAMLLYTAG